MMSIDSGERWSRSVVELTQPPNVTALYRRAALRALPGVGARRRADGSPPERGMVLPETTLVLRGARVDRAHLAGYDRVCGFRLSDTLPATYPHVLAFPLAMALLTDPAFPLPAVGLIHVANRIELLRPVDAEEPLDLSVWVDALRPHERGRQFDVVVAATVGTQLVWRGLSTYLCKHAGRGKGSTDEPTVVMGSPAAPSSAPSSSAAGLAAPTAQWRVDSRVGARYAAASGDRNPIHTSRLAARLFGFSGRIAHGMWSKAHCLAAMSPRLPDAYTVEVVFKRPIPLPSTVAFSASPPWSFALHDPRSGKPHLLGTVSG